MDLVVDLMVQILIDEGKQILVEEEKGPAAVVVLVSLPSVIK